MDKKRYLVPMKRETAQGPKMQTQPEGTSYSFLKRRIYGDGDGQGCFETPIEALAEKIKGHLVCGSALCPASIYTEMALAAMTVVTPTNDADNASFKLSAIKFHRPLLYTEGSTNMIRVTLKVEDAAPNTTLFEVSSSVNQFSDAQTHCSGQIKKRPASKGKSKLEATMSKLSRRQDMFVKGNYQTFTTSIMYNKIFSRVVDYSPGYQAVKKIYLDDDFQEIYATCQLPLASTPGSYAGHPVLLDTMLHSAGYAANLKADNDTVYICHAVRSMNMMRQSCIKPGQSFHVHCSNYVNTSDPECILADSHAVDDCGIIAVIKGMEFRRMKLSKMQVAFEYASRTPAPAARKPDPAPTPETPVKESKKLHVSTSDDQVQPRTDSVHGSNSPSTSTPSCVVSILSEATGVDSENITPRTELSAMGVDSIMIFELDKKLEGAMGQKPNVGDLSSCRTVGDMEKLVSASSSRGPSPTSVKHQARTGTGRYHEIRNEEGWLTSID